MKNAGMAGAVALVGIGLMTIGLSNFHSTQQAQAAPVVAVNHGPEEPTIVWYGTLAGSQNANNEYRHVLLRAWSDGTVEGITVTSGVSQCFIYNCSGWTVVSSPTEGMNAAADINFDEIVNGADLAMVLAQWGDAPRNPMPPSDCPLGLLNPS
jgi:hypothetical protein